VGSKPDGLAFTPNQHYLLVADSASGDIAIIRRDPEVSGNMLFTMVPCGIEPRQIAVKAFMLRKPPE
jgi:DNA-binding beta-propeller fold protein YncE